MNNREFGVRLTQFRERRRLSITQLANLLQVDYMQVSRYEKGQSLPKLDTAVRLAEALQVSLDELATGTGTSTGTGPDEGSAFQNLRLLERMRQLDQIPADRQEIALRVLDTVIAGHELETLSKRLRPS